MNHLFSCLCLSWFFFCHWEICVRKEGRELKISSRLMTLGCFNSTGQYVIRWGVTAQAWSQPQGGFRGTWMRFLLLVCEFLSLSRSSPKKYQRVQKLPLNRSPRSGECLGLRGRESPLVQNHYFFVYCLFLTRAFECLQVSRWCLLIRNSFSFTTQAGSASGVIARLGWLARPASKPSNLSRLENDKSVFGPSSTRINQKDL